MSVLQSITSVNQLLDAPTRGYAVVVKNLFQDTIQEIEIGRYDEGTYREVQMIFSSTP